MILPKKIKCMLSNAELFKQFWVEALSYATFVVNRFLCSGVEYKTPMDIWSGSNASYDGIHIFSCLAYYHIRDEKLDLRARQALFFDKSVGVKRFKLWCLQDKNILISNDVIFNKAYMLKTPPVKKVSSPVKRKSWCARWWFKIEVTPSLGPSGKDCSSDSQEDKETPSKRSDQKLV